MRGREALLFRAQQALNTTSDYEKAIRANCTITSVKIRIYDGPELALRLQMFIRDASGNLASVLQYSASTGAKNYIDGNDDEFVFDVRVPARVGDTLVVRANNTSATYAYDFSVDIEVDYAVWAQQYG